MAKTPEEIIKEHYRKITSKGGKARAAKYDKATLRKWAKKGGRPPKYPDTHSATISCEKRIAAGRKFVLRSGGRVIGRAVATGHAKPVVGRMWNVGFYMEVLQGTDYMKASEALIQSVRRIERGRR